MLSSVFHTGPVTALASVGGAILAGIGSRLHVYRIQPIVQHIDTYSILPGRTIHGIRHESYVDFEESRFCIFGQKCLRVIHFDPRSLEVKVSADMVEFEDWIWDVAWLQGGERLSLALGHNVIVVWDINSGTITRTTYCAEKCIVYCARFLIQSEAAMILAVGTVFNQVVLWSPNSEPDDQGHIAPFHRLTGHQGVIFSIDYHPVVQRICSVSDDRSLRLYQVIFNNNDCSLSSWENMETSLIHVLYGHSARVWDVRLMSRMFVSVGEDATCCVWSYDGNVVQKFKGHKGKSIWSMAVNSEEKFVVTGGGDSSIRLWNLQPEETETHTSMQILDLQINPADFPRSVQFLREHLVLIMTNEGLLLVIDTDSYTPIYRMKDDAFTSYTILSVSPRKHQVAIGNIQGTLRILDWNNGMQQNSKISDNTLYKGRITSIIWLDNDHILTSGPDGQMNIWRISDNKVNGSLQPLARFELPDSKHRWASAATLSQDMAYLVCGDKTGSVLLYSMDGRLIQMFPKIHKPEVTHVCLHGNQVYTAGRDGTYRLYDWAKDQLVLLNSSKVFKGFVWIEKLTITEDGEMLIQGFNANKFIVWSVEQNQKLIEVESGGGHRSWDFLFSCCHGNKARLLYIKAREVIVKEIQLQSHQLIVKGCLHGREVCDVSHISSSYDSSDNEHNQQDMHILHSLSGHISSVRSLFLCESSMPSTHNSKLHRKLLFSAGGRAQIKIWRLDDNSLGYSETFSRPYMCEDEIDLSESELSQNSEASCGMKTAASSSVINHSGDISFQNSSESLEQDNVTSNHTKERKDKSDHFSVHDSTNKGKTNIEPMQTDVCSTTAESETNPKTDRKTNSQLPISCQYESIAGVQLGSHKKRKGRSWKLKEDNSDPETRILDMTVFRAAEISVHYPDSLYFLTAACSDGLIRFFLFEEDSREVTFIASSNFHNHCILKVTHVNHKSERLTSALVLSAATDGRVAFWDVTDLCQSIVDDIMNDKTSKTGDRKSNSDISVFLEKRVQSQHTLSTCDFGSDSNSSTAADYVKESNAGDPSCEKEGQRSCEKKGQRSEVVPAAWLDCHQSGVNSIYLDKYEAPDTYILVTGGDDNALHINLFRLDELVTSQTGSPRKVKVICSGSEVSAHGAQITGVWYLGSNLVVTASIDQRVCVRSFTVQDTHLQLKLKDCKFIDVPDIANIDVWRHGQEVFLAVCGEGLEIIEIHTEV